MIKRGQHLLEESFHSKQVHYVVPIGTKDGWYMHWPSEKFDLYVMDIPLVFGIVSNIELPRYTRGDIRNTEHRQNTLVEPRNSCTGIEHCACSKRPSSGRADTNRN